MRGMTSREQLDDLSSPLLVAPAALDSMQEALQMLSGAWYGLAAEASPAEGLTREQEVRLKGALHDVAAAFARCARTCRESQPTVASIVSRRGDYRRARADHPGAGLSWFSSRVA
jgi:hypothetical protein